MTAANTTDVLAKLAALRTELVDLAFRLESHGRLDAADIAVSTSARIGELCDDLGSQEVASFAGYGS
jgi:hypothetical protein